VVESLRIHQGYSVTSGGGVLCEGSSPTFIDVYITDCGADVDGGGMACFDYSSPVLDSCVFNENIAQDDGGGLIARNFSSPDLDDCTFYRNGAVNRGGGALFVVNSFPTVDKCWFINNVADKGGGLAFTYAYGPINDCVIYANNATGMGGGAQFYGNAQCTVNRCTIVNNGSPVGMGGGVWIRNNSSPSFDNTIIAFNRNGQAVGRYADDCNPTFACCDLYGNEGGDWIDFLAGFYLVDGNFAGDPYFCDPQNFDYTLGDISPCAAANNPGCGQIGALGVNCSISGVETETPALAAARLLGCTPNPFNPVTKVRYELTAPGKVDLRVYDLAGRLVRVLKSGVPEPAGVRETRWEGRDDRGRAVAAGVYVIRLEVGPHRDTVPVALVK
jgi:hypothetical protein